MLYDPFCSLIDETIVRRKVENIRIYLWFSVCMSYTIKILYVVFDGKLLLFYMSNCKCMVNKQCILSIGN